jgi:hypothetical protein
VGDRGRSGRDFLAWRAAPARGMCNVGYVAKDTSDGRSASAGDRSRGMRHEENMRQRTARLFRVRMCQDQDHTCGWEVSLGLYVAVQSRHAHGRVADKMKHGDE